MLFIYWGWDSAVAVNEETKDPARTPGRAAIISTVMLVVRADTELRGLAAGWCLTAAAVLAAALALSIDRFSQLDVDGLVLVLGGSVGCALGGVVLGRRARAGRA